MVKIYGDFFELLKARAGAGSLHCEDEVRYLFFYAAMQNGYGVDDLTLEEHAYDNSKLELDSRLKKRGDLPGVAMEFKFHRQNGELVLDRPSSAGGVFNDINRLTGIADASKRLFIYVTDDVMSTYLNGREGTWGDFLFGFFTLEQGKDLHIDITNKAGIPSSFTNAAKGFQKADVKCVYTADMPYGQEKNLYLRIYEV